MTIDVEFAPAKINLTLRVLGRRSDGFHVLDSLVVFARDVGDRVSIDFSRPYGTTVTGPFAPALDGENLIAQAAREIAACGISVGHITLQKFLPVASGIGGGSADAAAVLRIMRRQAGDAAAPWRAIAARLGSDVPVCVSDKASRMSGTGNVIAELAAFEPVHAVLCNSLDAVPASKTSAVFRSLNAPLIMDCDDDQSLPAEPVSNGMLAYGRNDLAAPACRLMPSIADVLGALETNKDLRATGVSGAGPTCFGLFDTRALAVAAAGALSRRHPDWWIRPSRLS